MGEPARRYKVGYFVGSLSSTSINRILSRALIRVAPEDLEFTEIPIGNLPLYSQDHDADYPPEARALKQAISASDAVLFVTPEYNRSIPGGLATGSQPAIRWTKRALNNWLKMAGPIFDQSAAYEMLCFMGPDVVEGAAALEEKRAPRFPSAYGPRS